MSTPGVSARLASVELSEKPMTTPATASAPKVFTPNRATRAEEASARPPMLSPDPSRRTLLVESLSGGCDGHDHCRAVCARQVPHHFLLPVRRRALSSSPTATKRFLLRLGSPRAATSSP